MNESKLISLGIQQINGSMKAEDAVMMIAKKLSEFGFNLKGHIVGMVADGVAVVEQTGWLSEVLHQICHFHGIYLTVVNVLHKKNNAGEDEDKSFDRETIHKVTANKD